MRSLWDMVFGGKGARETQVSNDEARPAMSRPRFNYTPKQLEEKRAAGVVIRDLDGPCSHNFHVDDRQPSERICINCGGTEGAPEKNKAKT